jgi:hypothetical protein
MVELIPGFAWSLPKAFAEAVNFANFTRGDIIYDNPIAYELIWREAILRLRISIRVKKATPSIVLLGDEDLTHSVNESKVFAANWGSPLTLELTYYPSLERSYRSSTQGGLYTALWRNSISLLTREPPPIPGRWRGLGMALRRAKKKSEPVYRRFKDQLPLGSAPLSFALVGDSVSLLTLDKITRLRRALSGTFRFTERSVRLEEIDQADLTGYSPTTQVTLFSVYSHEEEKLFELLKSILYKPVPDPENPDKLCRFNLNMHGFLIGRGQAEFFFGAD